MDNKSKVYPGVCCDNPSCARTTNKQNVCKNCNKNCKGCKLNR
jgi:hypothetical protein